MRYTLCIFVFLLFCATNLFAQQQNNNWCFGQLAGVSFGPAGISSFKGSLFSRENCATISDRSTGKLLFYVNGQQVYDAQHYQMPHGTNIGDDNTGTSAQGSLIVPFSTDSNRYYVFTLDHWASDKSYLRYSVVDMTLRGGLGDVDTDYNGIIIDSNLIETMTCINSCSQTWICTIRKHSNDFSLIRITPSGIDPVRYVSHKGYARSCKGVIIAKFSPDVRTLALTALNGADSISYVALHDFDVSTGTISPGVIIDSVVNRDEFYGCEFSPDSKKLFTTAFTSRAIYQYNLESDDVNTMRTSRKLIATSPAGFGAPQIGPDKNIYFTSETKNYLDAITNCNAMSPACFYLPNAIKLVDGTGGLLTLPQPIRLLSENPYIRGKRKDTIVCNASSYTIQADTGHVNYLWDDNATTTRSKTVYQTGVYVVKITDSCFEYTDTFGVVMDPIIQVALGNDTAICAGKSVELRNQFATSGNQQWSTGSTAGAITGTATGVYVLTVSTDNCKLSDTITISTLPPPVVFIGRDTAICEDAFVYIAANSQPLGSKFLWNTGDTSDVIHVSEKGAYILTVTYKDCSAKDTLILKHLPAPYVSLGDDTMICTGRTITLPLAVMGDDSISFQWSDGSTGKTYVVKDDEQVSLRVKGRCGIAEDAASIIFRSCSVWFPSAFSPNGDGNNDLFKLLGDISHVISFRLQVYNRWGQCVFAAADARQGWDGRFKNADAEIGTYYYVLRITYKEIDKVKAQMWKGDVTLLR